MLDTLLALDISSLNCIRSLIDPVNPWQVMAIHILSDLGVIVVALVLFGVWIGGVIRGDRRPREAALCVLWSLVFALVIYAILDIGLPARPRPESMSSIRPLIDHIPDNSFPSGHAIFSGAAIMAGIWFFSSEVWFLPWIIGIFCSLMLFSRVAGGVHYPGDILVGCIIGILGAMTVRLVSDRVWFRRFAIDLPIRIASYIRL